MQENSILPSVIAIIVLIILSGYFSATETAFTSLNRIRLKRKADGGDERAKRVLELEKNYENLLSTILIGNNIVIIAKTAVATVLFVNLYGEYGATISTIVTTIAVLIFGEISPKSLAKEHPESFAMFSSPIIAFLQFIFTPLNWLFAQWKKMLAKIFKSNDNNGITEDELSIIVEEAETTGGLEKDQSELIQRAIEFNSLEAWDVLTPRVDIAAVEVGTPVEEINSMFLKTGFSRLPVFEDELDKILGVLNQKDFHNYVLDKDKSVADFVRPVVYVAGSMKASDLLKKLQTNKCRMAIVVDEYGGTAGIVTTEDIVEELVGEIYDESDTVAGREITLLQNGSYRILGSANVEKMFDFFDEEIEFDVTTVNGWVVTELDRLPKEGDKFEYRIGDKIFKVRVTKADGRKATEINLRIFVEEDGKGEREKKWA